MYVLVTIEADPFIRDNDVGKKPQTELVFFDSARPANDGEQTKISYSRKGEVTDTQIDLPFKNFLSAFQAAAAKNATADFTKTGVQELRKLHNLPQSRLPVHDGRAKGRRPL